MFRNDNIMARQAERGIAQGNHPVFRNDNIIARQAGTIITEVNLLCSFLLLKGTGMYHKIK